MNDFQTVLPGDFSLNPFEAFNRGVLLAAEKDGKTNAMTAGWGGFGVMWQKNVAFVVIRPQRYTHEFFDASGTFSVNIFGDDFKKMLMYMGTVSGRDEDKVAKAGLSVARADGAPYFAEARTAVICRKLYVQNYRSECFVEPGIEKQWYPEADFHTMYVGEIVRILAKL